MARPTRTNPAYAYLAYRRTVLKNTISWLTSEYVGLDGISPRSTLICEEVFRDDSEIPPEEILSFVEELQEEEARVQLELNKFDFVRKEDDVNRKATKAGTKGGSPEDGGKGQREGN